ncbi:ABC transporter ATP-binding protein [Tateyamaria omphalii]|uniref:ABC transporter ATP-binding protein n=1 Tax=Tateyamaria omphalii TaxID=299262 RepID=UPI001C99E501|nr:ABC transporter ATP-binding protein [Tateyamaria omphalii]MBY5935103.1 ABC transporter ATP-binding protein [Tateyamaria omphalii]
MTQALRLTGSAAIHGTPVFSQVDLTLEPGTWTCLLGASGVGKSTVLRLFAGLAEEVSFDGQMTDPGRVALMAQQDLLLPWLSVIDNVLVGARLRGDRPDKARAQEILAQVGLADHAGKRPSALSGGQRQRVALARTLMEDRPVILLDEPFSALDALTRAQMQDLTAELLTDRTVLLVTHDPAEAARLGQSIFIVTASGLIEVAAPDGQIPRPVDAPDVLHAQANLLNKLRRPR